MTTQAPTRFQLADGYSFSRIINGGQTNYILATYGLYLSIFNIFIHLLHILGVMSDD